MAKRTPRNSTNGDPDQTAPRRTAGPRTKKTAEPETADTVATANDMRSASEELPNIPEPGDAADRAQRSESMASEPSEQDIRLRAYHRFLERGGTHGRHFDDWLEAERELKARGDKTHV